jgi:hypothetical protein
MKKWLPLLFIPVILTGCSLISQKSATAIPPTETIVQPTVTLPPTIPPTAAAEPTASEVPPIVHKNIPGAPLGKVMQTVHDQVDENTAPQKQAFGGDDFKNGKYERPFDQSMNYLPTVDLVTIHLSREDPLWIYVLMKVQKPLSENKDLDTHFLMELDTNLDNRGDLLIITSLPKTTEWSTETVKILSAPDMNVGGITVVKPDNSLSEGRGYYETLFDNGIGADPDFAWSRLSKSDPTVVEMAFKNTLVGGEKGKFIWLPWSDAGMLDWSMFDFNDHMTLAQAGFPLKEDAQNYPLKALWGVDNTCRIPSNVTPNGYMPGLCPNYDPTYSRPETKNCPVCPPRTKCPPC